ncbi:hypothetical protein SLS62_004185 [Diatrype stigma]|uniref:Uncharacterized protein n=1 Tax=Diatrype stigma TaxID=117547 RepID=A0AAN9UR72_9PEZI
MPLVQAQLTLKMPHPTERVDKKPRSKAAEAGYDEDGQSSSEDEDEATPGNDEAAWELDDMASHVAPPSYVAATTNTLDENDSEEVKVRKEEQMVREMVQMAGPPPQPSGRLPCAVIIPQRRPRDKTRGFVRAYAPVLHDCGISQHVFLKFLKDWFQVSKVYMSSHNIKSLTGQKSDNLQADPWINVVFIAGGIVGLVPEVASQVVGAVAQVVAGTARELQSRYRQNTFLDRVNEDLFMPRGLYALVMTFKDDTPNDRKRKGPLTTVAGAAGKSMFSQERLDINQTVDKYIRADETMSGMRKKTKDIRLSSGKTVGEVELPEAAALVYPDLDRMADNDFASKEDTEGIKEKWKGAGKWVQDYLDRRAQVAYEMEHHPSTLNVPSDQRTPFLSRYSDPSHPARSGSLISLLTGGAVNPAARRQERRAAKQERRALKREYKDARRVLKGKEPRGPRRARLPKGQRKGIIKRIMQKDVLYLLIVNLPTQEEVQHSRAQLEEPKYMTRTPLWKSGERLSTLRLVNKAFCQSASIRLFRSIDVTVDKHLWQTDWPLARLLKLCNSPHASLVRRLRIGYQSDGEEEDWEPGNRYRMYAEDAARLLPVCLSRLPRLEVLDVVGPDFMAPCVPVVYQMQLFTDAVVSALRYIQLPGLAELNLRLAVTREYGEFFCEYPTASRIPIGDVMQELRHLEIAVENYTDHAWQLEPRSPRWNQPFLSGLRETWPNADFLASPLRLIELATGLESLSFCGADMHNMDLLRLGSEVCLKWLNLRTVAISAETLIRILGQCRHSLRGVVFFCVELNSGTWAEILNELSNVDPVETVDWDYT